MRHLLVDEKANLCQKNSGLCGSHVSATMAHGALPWSKSLLMVCEDYICMGLFFAANMSLCDLFRVCVENWPTCNSRHSCSEYMVACESICKVKQSRDHQSNF